MTIKQQGGVFGRNPSLNNVEANTLDVATSVSSPLIDTLRLTDDGASGLRVYSKQSGGRGLIFASGIIYPSGNSGATNNNGTDLGTAGVRFKDIYTNNVKLASGGGIDFSATSGTGTSELFDDYEEGSYTVELYDASSGGNVSSTTVTGYYTKIGQVVVVRFDSLNNINTTGMTSGNSLYITLPFVSSSTGRSNGSVITHGIDFPTGTTSLSPLIVNSSDRCFLQGSGTNVADAAVTIADISATDDIVGFCLTYVAA